MLTAEARRELAEAGVPERDLALPDDPPQLRPRQGALHVRRDAAWEVHSDDVGVRTLLARTSDEGEAVEFAARRLLSPVPEPMVLSPEDLQQSTEVMAKATRAVQELGRAQPGAVASLTVEPGMVFDRVGALDGVCLYPVGTPVAQRSLPPDAFEPRLPQLGMLVFGVLRPVELRARVVAPWFGQPGGGVILAMRQPGRTLRDLVSAGDLRLLRLGA